MKAGSETIPSGSRLARAEAPYIRKDDDIVHPHKKFWDKCKEDVPGSSPGRGAKDFIRKARHRRILMHISSTGYPPNCPKNGFDIFSGRTKILSGRLRKRFLN